MKWLGHSGGLLAGLADQSLEDIAGKAVHLAAYETYPRIPDVYPACQVVVAL